MSYGQAITPKIFHDTSVVTVTKTAYAHKVAKALVAVGMKFLPHMSTYDVLDARFEEGHFEFTTNETGVFFFAFPTTESFVIDGVSYLPTLGMRYTQETNDPTNSNGYSSEAFVFDLCARPAGSNDADRVRGEQYWRSNGGYAFGLGGDTVGWPSYQDGAAYYNHKWLTTNRASWSSYISTYGWAPIIVGNLSISLGPGGLTVFSGRSTAPGEYAQYHSFTVLFMGSRIPGRGLMTDPNLNRINPTILMPHRSTAASNLAVPGQYHHRTAVIGCQYNLTLPLVSNTEKRLGSVAFLLFNLVNLEDNESNIDKYVYVHDSPRLVDGVGRHLLEPIVGYPQEELNFGTNLFGRRNDNIGLSGIVCPRWAEYFYAPQARWADVNAPIGIYADPDTAFDWYITPPLASGAKLALNLEGATNETNSPVPSYGPFTTESFDVSTAGYASVFPRAVTYRTDANGPSQVWVAGSGSQNAQTLSYTYYSLGGYWIRKTWFIDAPTTDDPEDQYEFVFSFYVRTTQVSAPTGTGNAPYMSVWANSVYGHVPSNVSLNFVGGRSSGEGSYDLTEVVLPVRRAHQSAGPDCPLGKFSIAFHGYNPYSSNPGGTWTIRIENLRLRRRKRV